MSPFSPIGSSTSNVVVLFKDAEDEEDEEDAEDSEEEEDEADKADEEDEEDEEDEDDAEPRYDGGNFDVESTTRVAGTGARTPPTTSAAFLLATAAVTTSNVLMAATFLLPRVNALGAILIGGQQMWDRSVNGR